MVTCMGWGGNMHWTETDETPLNVPCLTVFTLQSLKCFTELNHAKRTDLKIERIKKEIN